MSHSQINTSPNVETYRIQGLSCTNCAAKFEKNIKQLPGVNNAQVNFGASKVYVEGNTTIQDLEKAGSFENLKITNERDRNSEKQISFWKQKDNIRLYIAAFIIVISLIVSYSLNEQSIIPTIGFGAAILIGGYSLFLKGLKNLIQFHFDMNTLMTIAVIGAALIGEWLEGAAVVILFAISEALERFSMDKARQSIQSLMDIAPNEALIRRGNIEQTINVNDIQLNDIMIVKPGQKIAMDGIVIKGSSSVNQSAITGESIPVTRMTDDEVFAGTFNEDGLLEIRVTKKVEDTTISKIIHLVEEAQAERAPSQAFVDKFAKYYTPVIMLIALMVAIVPSAITGDWSTWVYQGLAILVVGCPCALVISTPVAIVTAIGNAAKHGVLIKGGVYLEEAGSLQSIAFDKTGTLTEGVPHVTDIVSYQGEESSNLSLIAAIENGSQHPLAAAIIRKANENNIAFNHVEMENFKSITGKGVQATIDNKDYFVGSPDFFQELHTCFTPTIVKQIEDLQLEGKTVIILGTHQDILSLYAIADKVREASKNVVTKLNKLGMKTVMLTGDNYNTAFAIGNQVGVINVKSNLLPEDKLKYIKELSTNHQKTAMVGDGINDSPALAASTVGIAMGGAGTDTALETADIVLMSDDLNKLPYTMNLSRKTLRIIKENIIFSLGIKLAALLLVIPGWLTLWLAIFADIGATLIVTLNSLRLLRVKDDT
ncbi:heavy metal translocating P-type ATPase [Oceanobacillus sp. 1P07AA]|uniref:heavy metal translocating P-type ATPase n=1 Tax=Oceanobacillus sp. 1P07AA TaxID=3132293 RepID=UPI0039A7705E